MNLSRIAAVTGLCLMTACDIPTDIPIIDQQWIVPIETTTISVSQILPAGVTINGTRFAVNVGSLSAPKTLGDFCAACNGTASPPAFSVSFSTPPQSLPNLVTGADLASGTVNVLISNGFAFDPTANGGSVTVTVFDGVGGRVVGTTTITGSSLPAGQSTAKTFALTPGSVGASLIATTTIDSKAGGPAVTLNPSQQFTVTATPQAILVNSAKVNVANKTFNIDPQNLDVKDIDSEITDNIQEGAIIFDVTNPFGVALNATIRITYPGGVLTRTIAVPATATSSVRVSYTGAELKLFLGQDNVTLTGNGSIASSAGTITVTPTQSVQLKAKLDAKIQIGS